MRFTRRRSDRPDSARSRLGSDLEVLEGRSLLSRSSFNPFFQYTSSDLKIFNPLNTHQPVHLSVAHQLEAGRPSEQNFLLSDQGKIVTGKDRAGDEYTITVHGPGYVIVTDTTPFDGSLDDNIDTIQLVGTDINTTYVTGTVTASVRTQTSSTVLFNKLIDTSGVNSIVLNGFTLGQTITPASGINNSNTGIFLTGGVRYLQFHDILAPVNTATNDSPVNVIIGDPSTPLQIEPTIKVDSIFATVFDSSSTTPPANSPVTTPTVNIVVNGQIRGLDIFSTSQNAVPAASQFLFPVVGTTGRTAVQAQAIDTLNVRGGATNFTASRSAQPFQNGFTSLAKLGRAHFHGPTDAVGLDVTTGTIGSLQFDKGIGNPAGQFVGATTSTAAIPGAGVPATIYGLPADQVGYASLGLLGGQVTAKQIGSLKVGPATVVTQIPTNPDFVQLRRLGTTFVIPRPGVATTNALVVSSGNIGRTNVTGDLVNTEIKSGFHYTSFASGLEGTRAPSSLGPIRVNGNLLNSVVSATYRPNNHVYGTPIDTAGPGLIRGRSNSQLFATGGITPLTNIGAGYFARTKRGGYLPPPVRPNTVNGVPTF
jgi:hypothetical protein